ncbi:MAG: DUF4279 domain-containing protein [Planctomycetes bacterium]|nr:DUF4279 domain-containing protein [Planctomycetota bacterium]
MRSPKRAAYASLRFGGEGLDPSDITRLLVLPPSRSHRKGDLRITRTSKGRVRTYSPYSQGLWSMWSEGWVCGANLGTHVAWILDQLEDKRAEVAKILARGVEGDIFCYWVADHEPNIPRKIRERADSFGLEIGVDHYSLTLGDEEGDA